MSIISIPIHHYSPTIHPLVLGPRFHYSPPKSKRPHSISPGWTTPQVSLWLFSQYNPSLDIACEWFHTLYVLYFTCSTSILALTTHHHWNFVKSFTSADLTFLDQFSACDFSHMLTLHPTTHGRKSNMGPKFYHFPLSRSGME